MPIPQRIALTMPNLDGIPDTFKYAKWAEEAGFDDLWFADTPGVDSLTTASAVAMLTERVRIGTAIIPVFTRTPAVLAATAQVLHDVSGGRFILGLGSSSQFMMENMNGQVFEKPLTRVRETAEVVRLVLEGGRTAFEGETLRSTGYSQPPSDVPGTPPIYIAGLRAKMLEMAAEVGDGVIINLFPRDALPKLLEHIRIGAERAGKTLDDIEIVCRHQCAVTDDVDAARDKLRSHFAPYYATPVYNNFLRWAGQGEAADQIAEGWAARDRAKTTGALHDDLLDKITHVGSREKVQDNIRGLAEAGINTHIIACVVPEAYDATVESFSAANFQF